MQFLLTLKLFLISTGALVTVLGLHVSVPHITNFVLTHLSLTCNFFLSCFKPPYIFLLSNAIIITIVASTWFHRSSSSFEAPPYMANLLSLPLEEDPPTWTPPEKTETTPSAPLLEEVWKTITERREMALKKSKTFHERIERETSNCSLSRDELNRRVELL